MKRRMTEQKWLTSRLVEPMRDLLWETPGLIYKDRLQQHPRGRRRLRLFGVAFARRVIHLVSGPTLHQLLEAAEAFADGAETFDRLHELYTRCHVRGYNGIDEDDGAEQLQDLLDRVTREELAAQAVASLASRDARSAACFHANAAVALEGENMLLEVARQADLFRDIFGNPFRKMELSKQWRTDTAVTLARQMYDAREFSAMPILADALQDAGCENEDILAHCRDTQLPHVRGCWVVDLVLGKA